MDFRMPILCETSVHNAGPDATFLKGGSNFGSNKKTNPTSLSKRAGSNQTPVIYSM